MRIDSLLRELRNIEQWARETAEGLEIFRKDFAMGRAADAINAQAATIKDQAATIAGLKSQLASEPLEDPADVAAINSVLGAPSVNQPPASTSGTTGAPVGQIDLSNTSAGTTTGT